MGVHFERVGNGFPIPQQGMLSTNRGHHWILEDNTFQRENPIGLDIGDSPADVEKPEQRPLSTT